ncbi:Trans-enoyl reductase fsl5 [Aspergillus fumigatus]
MSELPSSQPAIIESDDGTLGLRNDVQMPSLEDDMILVKNAFVALNPIDTKMVGKLASPGAIAGKDFAGEVVSIGPKVQTAAPIKPGDRICGAVPGMHSLTPAVGAFAQYVGATDLTAIKIPEYMSLEEAVTLGSGIGTIGLALFKSLDVPGSPWLPADKPVDVLVYGGSTATGTLAIQLLKLYVTVSIGPESHNNLLTDQVRPREILRRHCCLRLPSEDMRRRYPQVHSKLTQIRPRLHF